MKFGYCVNMLSLPGSDGSGHEFIPMIAGIGFDYVELPMAQMMLYGDEDFERLFVRPLQNSGIPCRCCNNFLPAGIRLTGPDADHEAALRYAEKALGRAAALKAEKIVFGSAGARNYPLGFSREKAEGQIMAFLRGLDPLISACPVTIVLEHLNRLESNLLNSLGEGIRMRRELNLPYVQNLLDVYHLTLAGETAETVLAAGEHLRHVHIARTLGRSLPRQGDECDWQELFSVLNKISYDGDVSVEAYAPVENRESSIRESLLFLKSLL